MEREELIETARDMLSISAEACMLNPDTLSHPDRYRWAKDLISALEVRLKKHEIYPNASYNNQDEMAAALIVLAAADEDTYKEVVQFSYPDFSGDLSTIDGLWFLETICRDLQDDHNLCLKTGDGLPVLANEGYFPGWVRGACPKSVLDAVRPLAEVAVQPSGPRY